MRQALRNLRRHHWSDWAGFVLFAGMAFLTVATTAIGVLLIPIFIHEGVAAVTFLLRSPARQRTTGLGARAAAYGGTFIIPAFLFIARTYRPHWIPPANAASVWPLVGFMFWVWGAIFSIYGVWRLRRSFSIEPHARELQTSGPYDFARHPIYAAYILQYFGILLMRPGLPLLVVVLSWFTLMRLRIHYEERVLQAAFPEYAAYRERVGMFCPRLRRRTAVVEVMPASAEARAALARRARAGAGS